MVNESDYDPEIDAGSVYLTGEQAKAVVLAAAAVFRSGEYDEIVQARLLAVCEQINQVFGLGIEEIDQ